MTQNNSMKVQLYTPHPGQMALHNSKARFRVMACGRRFGKTLAATNELAKFALEHPHVLTWWVAPTYRQTEIAFDILSEALRPVFARPVNKSKLRIELINGSIIECRSAERYENMRGDGPSFVVFDEAAKCPKEAWVEVVHPALADRQGKAIFISTPWGRDWFWELFMRGQDPDFPDWWSHSFPTSSNPFITEAEIEQFRKASTALTFAQEFEAVFLDDAATVFRNVNGCATGELKPPVPGHYYVLGWDVAKYKDYSVMSIIDCNTREVVAFDRSNGIEYGVQIDQHLAPLVKEYNDAHVIMDITGVGDPLLEEVRKRDIGSEGYYFTNTTKKQLIDRAVAMIEQGQIAYPPIKVLLEELKAYGYEITPSKNIVYNAPSGMHDDCVISLALAIWGAKIGADVAYTAISKRPIVIESTLMMPPVQVVDDAFIMQRQLQMASSLRFLGVSAPLQSVTIEGDEGYGIA